MRKLFNFFAAALVMLAAASCEKNEVLPDNNSEGKVVTLKASINNGGTKTSLGGEKGSDDKYPVLWSEGDAIAVIQQEDGIDGSVYTFTLSEGGAGKASATFECNNAEGFNPDQDYRAVYPASSVVLSDGKFDGYSFSATQSYVQNSFSVGAMPMQTNMYIGTNNPLNFSNVFGVLKLQLKGAADEKVTSIVITSDNALSGEAELISGSVVLKGTADENKKVTLDCSADGGVVLNPGTATDFHIALPAGATGLKVLINTNKGSYYKEVPSQDASSNPINAITAGNILKMRELNTKNMAPAYIENGVYLGDGVALPAEKDSEGNPTKYLIWAPVNCGYDENHQYGLLYQWGRKYGQGYYGETPAAEMMSEKLTSADAGSYEVNKNNFYYVDPSSVGYNPEYYNWLNSAEDNLNLWYNNDSGATSKKTQYDPCPAGWRVPTSDEMKSLSSGFSTSNNPGASDKNKENFDSEKGYYFYGVVTDEASAVNKVFFPAAGCLLINGRYETGEYYDGELTRGYRGNYWTSTINGTYSHSLIFGKTFDSDYEVWYYQLYIKEGSPRASGFSVRCVKDMTQSQPMPGSN